MTGVMAGASFEREVEVVAKAQRRRWPTQRRERKHKQEAQCDLPTLSCRIAASSRE